MDSSFFKLKSHKDKSLFEHLYEVKEHANSIIETTSFFKNKKGLKRLIEIITSSHDFGKASMYFQRKLSGESVENELSRHGLISALFALFLVEREKFYTMNKIFAKIIAFNTIKHHHGNLRNVEIGLFDIQEKQNLKKVLDSIMISKLEVENIYMKLLGTESGMLEDFRIFLEEILNKPKFIIQKSVLFTRKLMQEGKMNYFFIFNLIYSILLEADKKSASGAEKPILSFEPTEKIVANYKKKFNLNKEFNKIREKIYKESIKKLEQYNDKDNFFEIDAPTGSGKTLTLLGSAFKLSEKIRKKHGFNPRIIYALPFISIIEQNYEIFKKVIENAEGIIGNEILLEHHHLADEIFETPRGKIDFSKSSFLIENWYSQIVVTTFFQLFKSIYTNKNHLLQKYNKLANSIILIDEIQAIPPNLLTPIRDCLKFLSEELNAYVILSTATQPKLNKRNDPSHLRLEANKIFSLTDSKNISEKEIDNFFNRYYLSTKLLKKEMTVELLERELEKNLDSPNIMVVLNTINATKRLYNRLSENSSFKEYKKIYLSTNIPPSERSNRIKRIQKYLNKDRRFILITTQLIEAGVDISIERIFRDMAPLDKIVQTSGRTNRNNERNMTEVIILNLLDESNNKREYSSYVYDNIIINITKRFLESNEDKIEERELYASLLPKYFDKLINDKTQAVFKTKYGNKIDLRKEISGLQFEKVDRYFRLIENNFPEISCFIIRKEKDKRIWEKYNEISEVSLDKWENYMDKKKKFSEIKKEFNRQIVTLRVGSAKRKEELIQKIKFFSNQSKVECNKIYCIDSENKELYDKNIGITLKENDSAMIF